jgi:dipeptidyl aminopeptidase/acylaminoacyl peptidase
MPRKAGTPRARKPRPIQFRDLLSIDRVSAPAVSPDGRYVAYVTSRGTVAENKVRSTIRLVDLRTLEARELTPGPGSHTAPAWSPDGRRIAFVSDREGGSQVWVMPLDGGEAKVLTSGEGGAGGPIWSPEGKRIAFSRGVAVSPHAKGVRGEPTHQELYGLPNAKSTARVETELMFRHWDSWRELHRSHVLIVDVASGDMADATPGDADVPPISLEGARDFVFSPNGRELAYVKNPDKVVTRSTNNSIFVQRLDGIRRKGKAKLVSDTKAVDSDPRYSPDGRSIAYVGALRPLYEADRRRVKLYDRRTGATRVLTEPFDRSASQPSFSADGRYIVFLAQDRGRESVYRVPVRGGRVVQLTEGTTNAEVRVVPGSGDLVVARETVRAPMDLWRLTPGKGIAPVIRTGPTPAGVPRDAGASAVRLTRHGAVLDGRVAMLPAEDFWYEGADGDTVHGFLVRPPGFDPGRRYPMAFIVHGGPQAAWMDQFHYRWNVQMFAAQGFVCVLPNPRGSSGYGDQFQDQISGDWGGRCYEDLNRCLEFVLARNPFIDPDRVAAAGASFGGFMVNWFLGHTDRFRAIVSHDGIFSAETMAYTTDELWFDEWEHGGLPHVKRDRFLEYSPHMHVGAFKTPTLVVQGEMDFRCPLSEGIALFTALQVMGVESKLLYFPDEGHWVLKPANQEVWYANVLGWLRDHLR